MSHAIDRMREERFKAFIEHPRSERDMAEASRRGRLLQSEPETPPRRAAAQTRLRCHGRGRAVRRLQAERQTAKAKP